MVTNHLASRGVDAKVDFIFDQMEGASIDVQLFFDYMTKSLPAAQKALISGPPIFRDDEDLVALQAADLLAWHLRREHEKGDVSADLEKILNPQGGHLVVHADAEVSKRLGEGFAAIPNLQNLQTKSQWRNFRRGLADLQSRGFIGPRGTPFKNYMFEIQQNLKWLFRRR